MRNTTDTRVCSWIVIRSCARGRYRLSRIIGICYVTVLSWKVLLQFVLFRWIFCLIYIAIKLSVWSEWEVVNIWKFFSSVVKRVSWSPVIIVKVFKVLCVASFRVSWCIPDNDCRVVNGKRDIVFRGSCSKHLLSNHAFMLDIYVYKVQLVSVYEQFFSFRCVLYSTFCSIWW
jgi:hypothetical protein